jgi:hypothetical protein
MRHCGSGMNGLAAVEAMDDMMDGKHVAQLGLSGCGCGGGGGGVARQGRFDCVEAGASVVVAGSGVNRGQ